MIPQELTSIFSESFKTLIKGDVAFRYRRRGFVLVGVQKYSGGQKRGKKLHIKNEIRENFYKKYRFTIKFSDNKAMFFIIYSV